MVSPNLPLDLCGLSSLFQAQAELVALRGAQASLQAQLQAIQEEQARLPDAVASLRQAQDEVRPCARDSSNAN